MKLQPLAWFLLGLVCLGSAVTLALHHPVAPIAALVGLCCWCVIAVWRPLAWLWLVPAALPFLNFSPWTGWLIFDEFDLLLLGTLAAGYLRAAFLRHGERSAAVHLSREWPWGVWVGSVLLAVLGLLSVLSLWRGVQDAGGWAFDWFAGYGSPLNSLRVFKSVGFALFFWPLLQRAFGAAPELAAKRLAQGVVAGLVVLLLAVLWERVAFVGLTNFFASYRTVGLFWEMHVGGAAIDSYLALTTPFVVWALLVAKKPLAWSAAAVLALATEYACLTTFSRGVYLATAGPLVLLAVVLWQRHRHVGIDSPVPRWRRWGSGVLWLVLVLELWAVAVGGTFMTARLAKTGQDLGGRLAHWQNGLGLLHEPADWWLGKGLGRLPANYAAEVPGEGFSGKVQLLSETRDRQTPHFFVVLQSPENLEEQGGTYGLTQRVSPFSAGQHRVTMRVRVKEKVVLDVALCERHLLYDRRCQERLVTLLPRDSNWQTLAFSLRGSSLAADGGLVPRLKVFSVALASGGSTLEVDSIMLQGPSGRQLLDNGMFERALAGWMPAAQSYFLPWHIDNLYLEVLIERGLITLLALVSLLLWAWWRLLFGRARAHALAPYLAASISGVMLVGLVSSVMDVPRVAFLFLLLLLTAFNLPKVDCKISRHGVP